MNKKRKITINKIKKAGIKKNLTSRQKKVLPILFMLGDIEDIHPDPLLKLLRYMTSNKSYKLLDNNNRVRLVNYLEKYGYNTDWLEEVDR